MKVKLPCSDGLLLLLHKKTSCICFQTIPGTYTAQQSSERLLILRKHQDIVSASVWLTFSPNSIKSLLLPQTPLIRSRADSVGGTLSSICQANGVFHAQTLVYQHFRKRFCYFKCSKCPQINSVLRYCKNKSCQIWQKTWAEDHRSINLELWCFSSF